MFFSFPLFDSKWLQKALKLWLYDPATRDAVIARKALTTTPVFDNQAITEIICSRTPSQLRRLKEVYLSTYHSYIEHDIENQTSGDHKKVLDFVSLCTVFIVCLDWFLIP